MLLKKKNKFKPLYKKFLNLRENIQNRRKILKFKKQKWDKFIGLYKRKIKWYNKFKPQNQNQYIVSKFPNRYTSYQKKYKNTLQSTKAFRFFYGNLKKNTLKTAVKNVKKKKIQNYKIEFLEAFERRLDVVLYRAKFNNSLRSAQQFIVHGKILVNNKLIKKKNYLLTSGDLISVNLNNNKLIINVYDIWPLPPKHLIINYKTMQIIFGNISNTNLSTLFSFYLNLEKVLVNFPRQ
jgi:ribosomal protein S4